MGFLIGVSQRCCPDCEALAAYIDRGLQKSERIQLEGHVATCSDCIALISSVVRLLAELSKDEPLPRTALRLP